MMVAATLEGKPTTLCPRVVLPLLLGTEGDTVLLSSPVGSLKDTGRTSLNIPIIAEPEPVKREPRSFVLPLRLVKDQDAERL